MDTVEVVVVGAGVIGLAVARALALRGLEVLILEAGERFGSEASSRNSEVVHAGIYYPPGSLKARLCVAGRELLYDLCRRNGIAHRRCGKLVVAASEAELSELSSIATRAQANGVELQALDRSEVLALEPALRCAGALYSPATGIVDSHELMLRLLAQAESRGATLVCRTRVTRIELGSAGAMIAINGAHPTLGARVIVNCAGLNAVQVAASIEPFPREHIPASYLVKGSYFMLAGPSPFRRLIYPVPRSGGLGVHVTLDLAGRARFGPDVQWVERPDYAVDPRRSDQFYAAIRAYWPGLPEGALHPAYAGIRPRISGPSEGLADFRIDGAAVHGQAAIVNLFGIESPGLTAALAIADRVAGLVEQQL